MILYVSQKGSEMHNIIDVCNKYYYTVCGLMVPRNKKTTTIMAASTIENSCASCNEIYKRSYFINPSDNIRTTHSSQGVLNDIREYHQLNIIGPKAKFEKLVIGRVSSSFRRLKQHVRHTK
jgi:hypothetical protein